MEAYSLVDSVKSVYKSEHKNVNVIDAIFHHAERLATKELALASMPRVAKRQSRK